MLWLLDESKFVESFCAKLLLSRANNFHIINFLWTSTFIRNYFANFSSCAVVQSNMICIKAPIFSLFKVNREIKYRMLKLYTAVSQTSDCLILFTPVVRFSQSIPADWAFFFFKYQTDVLIQYFHIPETSDRRRGGGGGALYRPTVTGDRGAIGVGSSDGLISNGGTDCNISTKSAAAAPIKFQGRIPIDRCVVRPTVCTKKSAPAKATYLRLI